MYRSFNRIIDLVTDFDIDGTLRYVLSMDLWDRGQIDQYQRAQFQKLTEHACQSDHYGSYRDCDLSQYPIVSKQTYRENQDAFYTKLRKAYRKTTTSGTTGSPFSFPVSKEMLLMKRVSHQKMLHWYGIKREASEMKMGGVEISTKVKLYYLMRNKRYLDINFFINNKFESIYRKYNGFKPTVLYGYPSAIYEFVTESAGKGLQIFTPKLIVTHGENLYGYMIDKLDEIFPTSRIVNQYWATEANIGVTCPSGNIHLDEDTVICEVINQDEIGVGDLVITNLYSYDFPLIRYNIGDRVSISENECTCGRKSRFFKSIEGRKYDEISLINGKRILLGSYYDIVQNFQELNEFQIIYTRNRDELKFLYTSITGLRGEQNDYIINLFQKRFEMPIQVTRVDKLQYEKSGKLNVHKTID